MKIQGPGSDQGSPTGGVERSLPDLFFAKARQLIPARDCLLCKEETTVRSQRSLGRRCGLGKLSVPLEYLPQAAAVCAVAGVQGLTWDERVLFAGLERSDLCRLRQQPLLSTPAEILGGAWPSPLPASFPLSLSIVFKSNKCHRVPFQSSSSARVLVSSG